MTLVKLVISWLSGRASRDEQMEFRFPALVYGIYGMEEGSKTKGPMTKCVRVPKADIHTHVHLEC